MCHESGDSRPCRPLDYHVQYMHTELDIQDSKRERLCYRFSGTVGRRYRISVSKAYYPCRPRLFDDIKTLSLYIASAQNSTYAMLPSVFLYSAFASSKTPLPLRHHPLSCRPTRKW
ncbi:hypothetical protein KP509_31G018600 [Ceratopteris richardii]|uniref:Uncharacterized protein n=1 Tax=Ceratopteris richardii TaxID=49495 RepID=A0A8T2QVW9_CERRI|nr:hypothetical protein KP509_31G018600 [Ceratopteris richardii]